MKRSISGLLVMSLVLSTPAPLMAQDSDTPSEEVVEQSQQEEVSETNLDVPASVVEDEVAEQVQLVEDDDQSNEQNEISEAKEDVADSENLVNIYTNPALVNPEEGDLISSEEEISESVQEINEEAKREPSLGLLAQALGSAALVGQLTVMSSKKMLRRVDEMKAELDHLERTERAALNRAYEANGHLVAGSESKSMRITPKMIKDSGGAVIEKAKNEMMTARPTDLKSFNRISAIVTFEGPAVTHGVTTDIKKVISGSPDEVFAKLERFTGGTVKSIDIPYTSQVLDSSAVKMQASAVASAKNAHKSIQIKKKAVSRSSFAAKGVRSTLHYGRFLRNSSFLGLAAILGVSVYRSNSFQKFIEAINNLSLVCNNPTLLKYKAWGLAKETMGSSEFVESPETASVVDSDVEMTEESQSSLDSFEKRHSKFVDAMATHEAALEEACNSVDENSVDSVEGNDL